jgi:hypothetical protein
MLRISHCLDIRLTDVKKVKKKKMLCLYKAVEAYRDMRYLQSAHRLAVRLSASRPGSALLTPEISWYSILLEAVHSRAIVRLEVLCKFENKLMISSGIEPIKFRLVSMWLNQLRYRVIVTQSPSSLSI